MNRKVGAQICKIIATCGPGQRDAARRRPVPTPWHVKDNGWLGRWQTVMGSEFELKAFMVHGCVSLILYYFVIA